MAIDYMSINNVPMEDFSKNQAEIHQLTDEERATFGDVSDNVFDILGSVAELCNKQLENDDLQIELSLSNDVEGDSDPPDDIDYDEYLDDGEETEEDDDEDDY